MGREKLVASWREQENGSVILFCIHHLFIFFLLKIIYLFHLTNLENINVQVFTWNTDAWGYGPGTTPLYQSHPWVLVVLPTGETLGVLADTTQKCEVYE